MRDVKKEFNQWNKKIGRLEFLWDRSQYMRVVNKKKRRGEKKKCRTDIAMNLVVKWGSETILFGPFRSFFFLLIPVNQSAAAMIIISIQGFLLYLKIQKKREKGFIEKYGENLIDSVCSHSTRSESRRRGVHLIRYFNYSWTTFGGDIGYLIIQTRGPTSVPHPLFFFYVTIPLS